MLETPLNIIVRMPNWLGDVVMATPILEDLKKKWPLASITAMCQSNVAQLLKYNPFVDHLYSFKKEGGFMHTLTHNTIIKELRQGRYDLGILLTNSLSSAWWFWRGHVKDRLGFATNLRSSLLTKAICYPENIEKEHLVNTYKSLLIPLGIDVSSTPPKLYVSEDERQIARHFLESRQMNINKNIIVGINPGAAFGTAKCWLPERFRAVIKQLLENHHCQVVCFGDETGVSLVNEITQGLDGPVLNLAGKTSLRELIALIQQCSVFLTNDSGPMHIASALGIPLVALFGSTSEVKTGPFGGGTIIHKHVKCSPCYKKVCPIDFRCMKQIEVEEVVAAIQKTYFSEK